MPREATLAGRLAALGFTDTGAAEQLLTRELRFDVGGQDAGLVTALAAASDPDLALAGLTALQPGDDLRAGLRSDPELRTRLFAVLGASSALAEHLRRHGADWRLLAGPVPGPAKPADLLATTDPDGLRVAYHRSLLTLAARDLTGAMSLDEVMAELADLATMTIQAALAIASSQLPPDLAPARLAVIAMGKCGARELQLLKRR